ncbi:ABC transporter permease [Acuticoccus sp. MNP-M23]|uniref:ABC transporter permease n=1 Tax=Acuticoccus sp. MNP-M23 TaxID=3072793 RepID=UPI002815C517|nr:ABC transporter permease [Acuticoccus sp. MNP-M23]WMS41944.1 ABC transporter permease [Acuticoccus sp. MNP-M23]
MSAPATPLPVDPEMNEAATARRPGRFRTLLARAMRSGALTVGLVMVGIMIFCAIFAPLIAPHDPYAQNILHKLEGPGPVYWLGTDQFGRDILSRIIYGARISLFVGFVSTILAVAIGVAIGVVSGFFGGRVDRIISGANDGLMSFPQIIMGIIIVALLGPSIANLILAITITAIPAFVRIARGSTIAIKERDFVDACRALGYGNGRIMFRHILPNIADEITVLASLWLATAIRTEATLSFIGLGAPPPIATWGGLVRDGFDNLLDSPGLSIFPSIAILIVMVGLNLIGDGLRDATDPRAPV